MKTLFAKFGGSRLGKGAVASSVTLLSVVPSAFAAEPTPAPVSVSALIAGSWPDFITLFQNIWALMTANPLLAFLTTIGIAFAGFRIFRVAKRAARR